MPNPEQTFRWRMKEAQDQLQIAIKTLKGIEGSPYLPPDLVAETKAIRRDTETIGLRAQQLIARVESGEAGSFRTGETVREARERAKTAGGQA